MSKENIDIKVLIKKYAFNKALTADEYALLSAWRKRMKYHSDLPDRFRDPAWVTRELEEIKQYPVDRIWEKTVTRIAEEPAATVSAWESWKKWIPAAALMLVLALGTFILLQLPTHQPATTEIRGDEGSIPVEQGVNSPGNILTLSNKKAITLDSISGHSVLATEQHTEIRKTDSNSLAYLPLGGAKGKEDTGHNTLSTRKTIAYTVNLSDGSKVCLNTGSTFRYPVAFGGDRREVELSGQAEFDIKKRPASPFQVNVNGTLVQVLGTRFTILAYPDEPVKRVTVLEGSVKVIVNKESVTLLPMQQAWITADGSLHSVTISDPESLLAWKKERQFHLDGKTLDKVLREVARYYDLKLPDMRQIKGRPVGGGGTLSKALSDVTVLGKIQALQHGQIHFSLKGDSLKIRTNP